MQLCVMQIPIKTSYYFLKFIVFSSLEPVKDCHYKCGLMTKRSLKRTRVI